MPDWDPDDPATTDPAAPPAREVVEHALHRHRQREQTLEDSRATVETARRRERRADAAARAVAVGAPRSQAHGGELSTFGEGHGRAVDVSALYGALIVRAQERLELLSTQLAAAYAVEGTAALYSTQWVTDRDGELFDNGEVDTALFRQERQAALDLERLITTAFKLKIDHESSQARNRYAGQMVALARAMAEQLGVPWDNTAKRAAQAAIVAARQSGAPTTATD